MDKIYDSIFKTMVTKNTNLLIPLINEVFGTEYSLEAKVTLLGDAHVTEWVNEENGGKLEKKERITDSYIRISGNNYHMECQSNPDGTIVLRMIEYDFHIALDDALRSGQNIMKFPRSAVLYLRHTEKTPDSITLTVRFPAGDQVKYAVPIIKVKEFSKEDIIRKKLYFLVPYYIMRVEERPLEQVLTEMAELIESMNQAYSEGLLTQYDMESVYNHLNGLVNTVYNTESVRKGVDGMFDGEILYTKADEIRDEGRAEGKVEGRVEGRAEGSNLTAELFRRLIADDRMDDLKRASEDQAFRDQLMDEYGLSLDGEMSGSAE